MVFILVVGMMSAATVALLIRDFRNTGKIKRIENTLKTYIKNGKERQAEEAQKTGHTNRHKPSNASTKTTRR